MLRRWCTAELVVRVSAVGLPDTRDREDEVAPPPRAEKDRLLHALIFLMRLE